MVQDRTCLPTNQKNVFGMFLHEELAGSSLDNARSRALQYLSYRCSEKYGFMGEAHKDRHLAESSVTNIPTSFDSGLLLPYLEEEGLDKCFTKIMTRVLKRSRGESGYWNHVSRTEDPWIAAFPYNVDNTSINMMALYITGEVSLTECRALGNKIIQNKLNAHGETQRTQILNDQRTFEKHENESSPQLCVGAITNCLWFLASIEMDTDYDVLPFMEYLNTFVDKLAFSNEDADGMYLPEMNFYSNVYVVLFFLSRLVEKFKTAQNMFGRKFEKILIQQSDMLANKTNPEALDVACMILAIMHSGLFKIGEQNSNNCIEESAGIRKNLKILFDLLLVMQDSDGSFPAWKIYQWNSLGHWGGSKCCTTGLALAALGIAQREVPELFTKDNLYF